MLHVWLILDDFKPKSVSAESETYIGVGDNNDVTIAVPAVSFTLTLSCLFTLHLVMRHFGVCFIKHALELRGKACAVGTPSSVLTRTLSQELPITKGAMKVTNSCRFFAALQFAISQLCPFLFFWCCWIVQFIYTELQGADKLYEFNSMRGCVLKPIIHSKWSKIRYNRVHCWWIPL